ncbi:MAG TPA: PIG-L family deacetylase [Thermoanaerobaculia bacterium]
MRPRSLLLLSAAFVLAIPSLAQQPAPPRPKTILAIGAHAGDMDLTAGPLLVAQAKKGDRVVLLHLTLGEKGNRKLSAEAYGKQKKAEAEAVAEAFGAEAVFGPWRDAELLDDEATKRWVATVIRRVKPDLVIAHWKESMHRDHAAAHRIANDAILLAALDVAGIEGEPWRGVRSVWYAENWEDKPGFEPYVFADVTASLDAWRDAVSGYEFARGIISGFPYIDYYTALATVRGAESWKGKAVAFAVEEHAKKRVVDGVP